MTVQTNTSYLRAALHRTRVLSAYQLRVLYGIEPPRGGRSGCRIPRQRLNRVDGAKGTMTRRPLEMGAREMMTTIRGKEIYWNGHLCEGDRISAFDQTLLLWTRCGERDVPSNQAYTGPIAPDGVHCDKCMAIWNEENGQFGVGG